MARTNEDYKALKQERLFSYNKKKQYRTPLTVEMAYYLEQLFDILYSGSYGEEYNRLLRAEIEEVLQFQDIG